MARIGQIDDQQTVSAHSVNDLLAYLGYRQEQLMFWVDAECGKSSRFMVGDSSNNSSEEHCRGLALSTDFCEGETVLVDEIM